jgi:hypothetical protein
MGPNLRRVFAFLAACGFAVSIVAYVETFSVSRADAIFQWGIVLFPELMVFYVLIFFLEYPASKQPNFAWTGFARGMPSWVAPGSCMLWVIFLAHFVWFGAHTGFGLPEILDGQYALVTRGRILSVLTQAEYVEFRAAEARTCGALMITCYFLPLTYWWFRRRNQTVV